MFEQMTEFQMAAMSKFLTDTPNKIKELSEAKGYKELVTAQSDMVKQYSDECLGAMRKSMQIMSTTRDDLTKWVEKGMSVASEVAETVPMPMAKKVA
jgi:phasin family protein